MASRDDSGQAFLVVVVLCVGLLGLGIWKFSNALGIDMSAGISLFVGFITAVTLLGVGWWQQSSYGGFLSVRGVLPLAIWFVWLGMGPALQQWGAIGPMFAGMTDETRPVEWWANGYTRWGVSLLILGGGYWLFFRQERY